MASDNVRKLSRDPAGRHVFAKRTNAGSVATTNTLSKTGMNVSTNSLTTLTTKTVTSPSEVLFTSASLTVKGTTGVTATLSRDGSNVLTTDNGGTGTSTTATTGATHTTPLVGPRYKVKAKVTGTNTTGTVTAKVTREQQWSGNL